MSYRDKKITQTEINAHNVKSAPDVLVGNASNNKQVFDNLPEFIATKHNTLIDSLDATQEGVDSDISDIKEDVTDLYENKADNTDFVGFTPTQESVHGLVPAASDGRDILFGNGKWEKFYLRKTGTADNNKLVLVREDGEGTDYDYTWSTFVGASTSVAGLLTSADKAKLDGIATGAEKNVQADWNVTSTSSDAYIKHKPVIDAGLDADSTNAVQNKAIFASLALKADYDVTQQQLSTLSMQIAGKVDKVVGKGLSENDYTTADKAKLYDVDNEITAERDARIRADEAIIEELESKILSMFIKKTASGARATFNDGGDDVPVANLEANIHAVQEGTGDPSPTNKRPISGWDSASIIVSPTTAESAGTTHVVALDRTVYGGKVNIVSGTLTITHITTTIDASSNFTQRRAGSSAALFGIDLAAGVRGKPVAETVLPSMMANEVPTQTAYYAWRNEAPLVAITSTGNTIWFRLPGITTVADAKAYLGDNPLQVVYELSTPQTYQITPVTDIKTILGTNNVWSNTGEVSVTYRADPTLAYQELANA